MGIDIPREAEDEKTLLGKKEITIFSFDLEDTDFTEAKGDIFDIRMKVSCSKGTYIRTLVDDLGELLGCGAHVIRLNRTAVSSYPIDRMVTFDDLNMKEQEFNDFKSVYFKIYDDITTEPDGPISVLDDIDFELELLRNDQINVDYIIKLMEDLDFSSTSFEHDKERILKLVNQTQQLRSKIDLIEKFINEKLGNIDTKETTVGDAFEEFMRAERRAEICSIIDEENLDESVARKFFEKYEFSGKLDDDLIKESFKDTYKYKARKNKVKTIKNKVTDLFEKFNY